MKVLAMNNIKKTVNWGLSLQLLWMILLLVAAFNVAYASKVDLRNIPGYEEDQSSIDVMIGKGTVFALPPGVSDVMIANTSIAEVTPLKSGQLYIAGIGAGDTNIIIIDATGNVIAQHEIHVRYDTKAIQGLVNRLSILSAAPTTQLEEGSAPFVRTSVFGGGDIKEHIWNFSGIASPEPILKQNAYGSGVTVTTPAISGTPNFDGTVRSGPPFVAKAFSR